MSGPSWVGNQLLEAVVPLQWSCQNWVHHLLLLLQMDPWGSWRGHYFQCSGQWHLPCHHLRNSRPAKKHYYLAIDVGVDCSFLKMSVIYVFEAIVFQFLFFWKQTSTYDMHWWQRMDLAWQKQKSVPEFGGRNNIPFNKRFKSRYMLTFHTESKLRDW